ncbi:putative transcriptional regulator [Archaeoglobus sulfaticallidus PM70-1]|uniref:Putative transcriptional regulator n=1 Tax=Archaeoglobus sulfaticallidus PM70-1 TaxID=387631 RepID=N0BBZ4_9EURY|nr:helix-turn-helix domain-containing protein [Archaeoglobus sulfaticallidus]AGK60498.1 putative transcriptional regulator [Archaeoglobus sulfaticallidus PM70-1]
MKLVNKLKAFGFSDYEARALTALLSQGEMSAKEISLISGIPRTSVYDVMDSLVSKGFVEAYGKPRKFKALQSDEIIKIISERVNQDLEFIKKELPKFESAKIEEVRVYRGDLVLEKLKEFTESAKESIYGMLSYIHDDVKAILEMARCKLVLMSFNASTVRNAEAYEFTRKELMEEHKDYCNGMLVFDDIKTIFMFKGENVLAIVSESPVIAMFAKEMLNPLLESLKKKIKNER